MNYLLLLLMGYLAAAPLPAAAAQATKVVYIQGGELFVASGAGGQARRLTRDGGAKTLPVWSRDGSSIAFLESAGSKEELGRLRFVDEDGHTLQSIPVRAKTLAGGMRFIETLEWLDHGRVAISGSANPSLTETAIVDLATGDQEAGIFDDGPGADFSPDGKHFALTSGAPHFTPTDEQEPALEIDYKRVYPPAGVRVELVSDRSWSPDSRKVAIIARDFATKRQKIVIASVDGGVSERQVELPAGSECHLLWAAGEPVTACGQGGRAVPLAAERASAQRAVDLLQQALSAEERLITTIAASGGREANVWCKACPLSALPRKASTRSE